MLQKNSKNRKTIKTNHKEDDQIPQADMFSDSLITTIMKRKQRTNIYDLKNEDFNRLVTLNKVKKQGDSSEKELEEVDEYFEEIGDIDPK